MAVLWPSVAICLAYVLLVTVIGPRFMANRKPMEVKNLMVWYNFAMVGICAYILYEVSMRSSAICTCVKPFQKVQNRLLII